MLGISVCLLLHTCKSPPMAHIHAQLQVRAVALKFDILEQLDSKT